MARPTKGTTLESRFHASYKKLAENECWPWARTATKKTKRQLPYGRIKVGNKTMLAHRVSLEISLGRSLALGMCALHKCDNTLCVNPAHLFEGTQKDNLDDCRSKGRLCPSEEYESAKLTDKIVRFIKKHYRPWSRKRRSMYAFSEMFDISVSIVSDIIHGKRWRHVT